MLSPAKFHSVGTPDMYACRPRVFFSAGTISNFTGRMQAGLPLRLAYACTFNDCLRLTLDKSVLARGQLYTARKIHDEFETTTTNDTDMSL